MTVAEKDRTHLAALYQDDCKEGRPGHSQRPGSAGVLVQLSLTL